jgi:hypothetical protein
LLQIPLHCSSSIICLQKYQWWHNMAAESLRSSQDCGSTQSSKKKKKSQQKLNKQRKRAWIRLSSLCIALRWD